MKKQEWKSSLMLLLTAAVWGVAFVAQSVGMDYIGPFTFNSIRSLIGGLVLIPCIWFLNREKSEAEKKTEPQNRKKLIVGGICCGVALAVASSLQQMGIQYTSVGKAGFITALYIVIVPLLGLLFKKRVSSLVWIAVVVAVGGMYLLCITEGFSIGKGDLLVMACAFCFSVHILIIDYFSPKVDGAKDVLHPVFGLRAFMCCTDVFDRTPVSVTDLVGLGAIALCGCFELWSGVYASNCRTTTY